MFERAITLALLAATLAPCAAAQTQRGLGGGCGPSPAHIVVSGPLTIGNTMFIDEPGCMAGPGTQALMLFGLELTPNFPIDLETSIIGRETCFVSVMPFIGTADFTNAQLPIPLFVPNNPSWIGFPLAMQTYCVACGFAGCFPTLSRGLEVTFG